MSKRRRGTCFHPVDNFCYICGHYLKPPIVSRPLSYKVKVAYRYYFGFEIGNQDKSWTPHQCCNTCEAGLQGWLFAKDAENPPPMPFAVPVHWMEPKDHISDCYFCLTKIISHSDIVYGYCRSATEPIPHGIGYPVPVQRPDMCEVNLCDHVDCELGDEVEEEEDFMNGQKEQEELVPVSNKPILINQQSFDDIMTSIGHENDIKRKQIFATVLYKLNLVENGCYINIVNFD